MAERVFRFPAGVSRDNFTFSLALGRVASSNDAPIATSVLGLAVAMSSVYLSADRLPELLAPIRSLATGPIPVPSLRKAVAKEASAIDRTERRATRSRWWGEVGAYASTMTMASALIAVAASFVFGYDWVLATQVGWTHGHLGAITTTVGLGAMLLYGTDQRQDWLFACAVAASGFLADLPFWAFGVPEYAAGISASVAGIVGMFYVGSEAWSDTKRALGRIREERESGRVNRELAVDGALKALDAGGCAAALASGV